MPQNAPESVGEGRGPAARVILVEDHPVVRQSLLCLLAQAPDFQVVAESGDGAEALRLVLRLVPDVLVTDLIMPGMHGLELARRVRAQVPLTRLVIVSVHTDEAYVREAHRIGVLAYVCKDEVGRQLVPAIRSALKGKPYLSHSLQKYPRRKGDPPEA